MRYTREQLSAVLEEISGFEVELADDPTLPSLGTRYLSERIAMCRKFLNRVVYYVQTVSKQTKDLMVETRQMELDLELKMSQKLADDELVRKQPSIEDRRALATMLLKAEHDNLATLRVDLMDVVETLKIIKMKHQDLVRTNADVKSQRQLVRDDIDARLAGGDGYNKPQTRQDRSVPDGMPPPVSQGRIDPQDLLDPAKRPADMPEPVDPMHAQQIADFFDSRSCGESPVKANGKQVQDAVLELSDSPEEQETPVGPSKPREYDDKGARAMCVSLDDI